MAVKPRTSSFLQVLHLLLRLCGLTGAMAALVGAFLWGVLNYEQDGLIVMAAGGSAVVLALFGEVRAIAQVSGSRRGAFGFNAFLQIAVAITLVGGVNYYSFYNFKRFDLTSDKIFTLDEAVRSQLAQLQGDTEIIVFRKHVSFGMRGKEQDSGASPRASDEAKQAQHSRIQQERIDHAAQGKIIEKIKDLAEQFGDLGPRFRVQVLDLKEHSFDAKLAGIREMSAELADAVEAAPENSIFFYSRDQKRFQRLGFNDIYQIDTQGSIENENLVLKYQGEKPFANRIFNIESKRPRVANVVIHPVLGLQNKLRPEYTMSGAKKVFDEFGFESVDLMVRKLGERGRLTDDPTALTYDESRFEQIEDGLAGIDRMSKIRQKDLDEATELHKMWSEWPLAKLNTKFVYFIRPDGAQGVITREIMDKIKKSGAPFKFIDVDEDDRKFSVPKYKEDMDIYAQLLDKAAKKKKELQEEKSKLRVEDLAEKKRMTDIEARTKRMLADVDLLIVPRMTIMNAPTEEVIPMRVHKLDNAHLNAVKQFMREGKPVLFLLGPPNEPGDSPAASAPADALEGMLAELGFKMPRQTVLYDIETDEYNERKLDDLFARGSGEVQIPGLKFDETTSTTPFTKVIEPFSPHSIRSSMTLVNRTVTKEAKSDVRIRHPRPIYFARARLDPKYAAGIVGGLALPGMPAPAFVAGTWLNRAEYKHSDGAVFLVTQKDSWNEENPFIVDNKIPNYTATKDDDPKKGTLESVRRGPFPIGVAVETTVPASWNEKDTTKPKPARIAVIGSGGAFVGSELTPLQGKLLLDVSNWLIGRDDLLARDVKTWQYPRVEMTHAEYNLWQWGAVLGLPLLFSYLGTVVWMVRRMR